MAKSPRNRTEDADKPPSPVYAAAAQGLGMSTVEPVRSDARGYLDRPAAEQGLTVNAAATGLLNLSAVEAFVEQVRYCPLNSSALCDSFLTWSSCDQPERSLVASAAILVPDWFQATEVPQDISINVLMWTGCTANRMLAQCCHDFNKVPSRLILPRPASVSPHPVGVVRRVFHRPSPMVVL